MLRLGFGGGVCFVLIRGLYVPSDTPSTSLPFLKDKKAQKWSRFVRLNSWIGSLRLHLTFSQSPVLYIISRPHRLHSNNREISRANKQSRYMKRYLFLITPVRQTTRGDGEEATAKCFFWMMSDACRMRMNHTKSLRLLKKRWTKPAARYQGSAVPVLFPFVTFNYQTLSFKNDLFYHYRRSDCPRRCILHEPKGYGELNGFFRNLRRMVRERDHDTCEDGFWDEISVLAHNGHNSSLLPLLLIMGLFEDTDLEKRTFRERKTKRRSLIVQATVSSSAT